MLIWDTGLYEVLPYRIDQERSLETEEESGDGEEGSRDYGGEVRSESEKLRDAFRDVCPVSLSFRPLY